MVHTLRHPREEENYFLKKSLSIQICRGNFNLFLNSQEEHGEKFNTTA
jgi:hypothetical protein